MIKFVWEKVDAVFNMKIYQPKWNHVFATMIVIQRLEISGQNLRGRPEGSDEGTPNFT